MFQIKKRKLKKFAMAGIQISVKLFQIVSFFKLVEIILSNSPKYNTGRKKSFQKQFTLKNKKKKKAQSLWFQQLY